METLKTKKPKRYSKQQLRVTLERNMRERRGEPEMRVSPMEFSRWLKAYVSMHDLPDELCKARTLDESVADAFGKWLGYPLLD